MTCPNLLIYSPLSSGPRKVVPDAGALPVRHTGIVLSPPLHFKSRLGLSVLQSSLESR